MPVGPDGTAALVQQLVKLLALVPGGLAVAAKV